MIAGGNVSSFIQLRSWLDMCAVPGLNLNVLYVNKKYNR